MTATMREAALELASDVLTDIELDRVRASALVRKTSRLARLLDDAEALEWLSCEVSGYAPAPLALDAREWSAAVRSNRVQPDPQDGNLKAFTSSVGQLEAAIEAGKAHLSAATGAPPFERQTASQLIAQNSAQLDRVVGAIYTYVSSTYQELRFGAAVESAFESIRKEVDAAIGALIPNALSGLAAALENASSGNPEHWADAAATCRRLLKAAADELRPPGPDLDGRKMDDPHYVNRLVDWIQNRSASRTYRDAAASDLQYLGQRLDAFNDAGHKGAHSQIDQFDAARFVTGTYLLLGDLLHLRSDATSDSGTSQDA